MIIVLIVIGAYITFATTEKSHPEDAGAGAQVGASIAKEGGGSVVVVIGTAKHSDFVASVASALQKSAAKVSTSIGGPQDARAALEQLQAEGTALTHIACDSALLVKPSMPSTAFSGLWNTSLCGHTHTLYWVPTCAPTHTSKCLQAWHGDNKSSKAPISGLCYSSALLL